MASTSSSSFSRFEENKHYLSLVTMKLLEEKEDEVDDPTRWEKMTSILSGKSPKEIEEFYTAKLAEYDAVILGLQPTSTNANQGKLCKCHDIPEPPTPPVPMEPEKRELITNLRQGLPDRCGTKGQSWSKEEHRLFLLGMELYGKGDWRNISRYLVLSRTPTQIASHAQKFFRRNLRRKNEGDRPSIHDIRSPTQTQPLPRYMQHIYQKKDLSNKRQHVMPTHVNMYKPLTPVIAPYVLYYPNKRAHMVPRNDFGRL